MRVGTKGQQLQAELHRKGLARIIEAVETGEITPDMGCDAMSTLVDWYDATGMAIDATIPAFLRVRRNKK